MPDIDLSLHSFHGGGWALGDLEGEDRTCRVLCVNIGMVVVSVNYRLYARLIFFSFGITLTHNSAPEHPYPAALNDAWAALQWVRNQEKTLMVFENNVFLFSYPGACRPS